MGGEIVSQIWKVLILAAVQAGISYAEGRINSSGKGAEKKSLVTSYVARVLDEALKLQIGSVSEAERSQIASFTDHAINKSVKAANDAGLFTHGKTKVA